MKKDIGKWWDFHKIPWHNTNEFHTKQSSVAELKASELDLDFDSNWNIGMEKKIIDAEPSAIVATTIPSQKTQRSQRKVSTYFTRR